MLDNRTARAVYLHRLGWRINDHVRCKQEGIMAEAELWYAHPNDLIGGWSVLTIDGPPSRLGPGPEGREVATFCSEEDARRIAALHNADIRD